MIGTPLIRGQNLPKMLREVDKGREFFDIMWWVARDVWCPGSKGPDYPDWARGHSWIRYDEWQVSRTKTPCGENLQNLMLSTLPPDTWWWGLADDNLPTPGFFKALREEVDAGAEVVVFPCQHSSGLLKSEAEAMHRGRVDGSQVAFKKSVAGDLRWVGDDACVDGVFVEELYKRCPEKFRFRQEPVLGYNALRP